MLTKLAELAEKKDQVNIAFGNTQGLFFWNFDIHFIFGHEPLVHHEQIQAPNPFVCENA